MFVWIVGLMAMSLITAIFGYTGFQTPSTDVAVFLFHVFSTALIVIVAWTIVQRHDSVIGHNLHRPH